MLSTRPGPGLACTETGRRHLESQELHGAPGSATDPTDSGARLPLSAPRKAGLCLTPGGVSGLCPEGLRGHSHCFLSGDRLRQTENRATRCKVERLQLLLQQKRLRRKARRDARGPYHWPPSRKAGRSDTTSGGGGGGPSEASGLGLDFEDSVWKPEVNPDIKSEFVVA